ncbi:hypothetical protein CANINC_000836 [Pichia inconspicua]|uniref:non-specific serine/threonine protein kinase n=1 Tax=Pichia inconspicua TaxID=52247 RepID=A0A4T0X5C8_9ASCO|nr:hypothetical protein CANINC_000836 [[Candida] inconspicua]
MSKRYLIDERAVYIKRSEEYTNLIKKFAQPELTTVGNYKLLDEIGSGAFGKVYLGYHSMLRLKVCLKKGTRIATKSNSNSSSNSSLSYTNDNLMREFYYLREFRNHPHVTKLYEIVFTESSVYMILEYYPSGDLFEYVTKQGNLNVDEALRIFVQIAGAVHYLHKNGCCHRDLKLENVLLDKQMNVKLSDFGFTRELPFMQHGPKSLLSEYCGTGAYMAPEMVKRIPYSGIKIDIWALGVILYTILAGEMPFDDSLELEDLEHAIINETPKYLKGVTIANIESNNIIDNVKYLMCQMLSKNAEERLSSVEELLDMSFLIPYGSEKQLKIVRKLMSKASVDKRSWSTLSTVEKALFKDLVNAGIDKEILKRTIQEETLDTVYGIWSLLQDQKTKKEKKSRKLNGRSVMKLTRTKSKSIMGTAKQAFSPSPVQSDAASSTFLSRNGSSKKQDEMTIEKTSLNKTGSANKTKSNIDMSSLKKLHSIDEHSLYDQASTLSKSTQYSNESKKKNKGKLFKPLLDIFRTKPTIEEKNRTKRYSDEQIPKFFKSETTMSNTKESTLSIKSQTNRTSPVTPDYSKLKRTKPTRPGSEISMYSAHSMASETSNGSGYITGYSTDTNLLNTLGNSNSNLRSGQIISIDSNNEGLTEDYKTLTQTYQSNNSGAHTHDSTQYLSSPQNSSKPRFSRAISDWSTTFSQAESPNSSYVTLSRTNSVDSSSNKKKKTNNTVLTSVFMPNSSGIRSNRGRSPLNSKLTTKWTTHNDAYRSKPIFSLDDHDSLIIEEEDSELDDTVNDDNGEDDDGDDEEEDDDNDVVDMHAVNLSDITEDGNGEIDAAYSFYKCKPSNKNGRRSPSKSGRIYMRNSNMRFPIPPVTEENDQDLEDDADVEEDNNDEECDNSSQTKVFKGSQERYSKRREKSKKVSSTIHGNSMKDINDEINRLSVNDTIEAPSKERIYEDIEYPQPKSQANGRVYSPTPVMSSDETQRVIQNLEDGVAISRDRK